MMTTTWTPSLRGRAASGTRPRSSAAVLPPAADLFVGDQRVRVVVDLPGVDPADLDVEVRDRVLSLRGTRRPPPTGQPVGSGKVYGGFARAWSLPDDVDPQRVDARLVDGVLTIDVPRRAPVVRHVPVIVTNHDGGGAMHSIWERIVNGMREMTQRLRRAFA
jgi:HSP20 family protein